MKEKLYELIVEEKKVPFKDLIDQHFSLPVDRVSRFLDMLNDEYTTGESNQLKQFFLIFNLFCNKLWVELNLRYIANIIHISIS